MTNAGGAGVPIAGSTLDDIRLSTGFEAERTFALSDTLNLTPLLGARAGVSNPNFADPWSDVFGGVEAGLGLTAPNWSLRGIVHADFDSTGFGAASVRGSFVDRF